MPACLLVSDFGGARGTNMKGWTRTEVQIFSLIIFSIFFFFLDFKTILYFFQKISLKKLPSNIVKSFKVWECYCSNFLKNTYFSELHIATFTNEITRCPDLLQNHLWAGEAGDVQKWSSMNWRLLKLRGFLILFCLLEKIIRWGEVHVKRTISKWTIQWHLVHSYVVRPPSWSSSKTFLQLQIKSPVPSKRFPSISYKWIMYYETFCVGPL